MNKHACLNGCDDVVNCKDGPRGGVKGLIVTKSNLVVTWKVRPHIGIIY